MRKTEFDKEIALLGRTVRKLFLFLIALAVLGYLLSGVYSIQSGETGIRKRFGKVVESNVPPGIHYRLPSPFEMVHRVATSEIKRVEAGFGAPEEKIARLESMFGSINKMQYGTLLIPYVIAGDKNIIHVHVIAAYQILKPMEYTFRSVDPERILTLLIQQHLLTELATMHVDEVLLTGKAVLKTKLTEVIQESIDEMGLGIRLVTVDIKRSRPPQQVEAAFKDVIDAQEQRGTAVHDAESYRNELIPRTKAEADRIVTQAQSFADEKIAKAEGQSQRFTLLEREYRQNPEIVAKRIYLESLPGILLDVNTYLPGSQEVEEGLKLNFISQ